jgi:hypothetical protein
VDNWICVSQGRDKWQAVVDMVMCLWVRYSLESFLAIQGTSASSGRTLLHGISCLAAVL